MYLLQFFAYAHLPANLQVVSMPFSELANFIVNNLPDNPERTTALRKLLEAKDCAVRRAVRGSWPMTDQEILDFAERLTTVPSYSAAQLDVGLVPHRDGPPCSDTILVGERNRDVIVKALRFYVHNRKG